MYDEHVTNSNLEKLRFVIENDNKFILSNNSLKINLGSAFLSINLNEISNVRIIKRRCLLVNYLMMLSTFGIYLLLVKIFVFNVETENVLKIAAFISAVYSFFICKYSYVLLLNHNGFNFNIFKLSVDSNFEKKLNLSFLYNGML